MVMNAGKDSSPDAREAFGKLYRLYLPPLLAFVRREGRSQHEAEDLIQGFFEFLLEKRSLGKVRPEGKFRCWLLVSLKHYLSDVWDKARAVKRGGDQPHVALVGDEGQPKLEPPDAGRTPEEEYNHEFALQFLDVVMGLLQEEYRVSGKARIFEGLRPLLLDKKGAISHDERGQELGMSANAVTTEVSRMRKRYREIFDRELEELIGSADDLEAEKRFLFALLSK
jgi:RNA polymerase sigma-70 factor (ECF subfamily)